MKLFILLSLLSLQLHAGPNLLKLQGVHLLNEKETVSFSQKLENKKGLVVLFLSSKCPCSDSHVDLIKKISSEFSEFSFVAIHSNQNEPAPEAMKYFAEKNILFPVIEDKKLIIADELKALKTPHAFVISPSGEILYEGGVTDSAKVITSKRVFLREALEDINQSKNVRTPVGRTLGCMIAREVE